MIRQDKQEEEEKWRDRLEYLARFWNNEAVDKIQQAREREQEGKEKGTDEQFDSFLEDTFGRGIGSDVPPEAR